MNKPLLFFVSLFVLTAIVRTASATCNPCIRGSGCEAPCIDNGTCACNQGTGEGVGGGGTCANQALLANYEFQNGAGPNTPNGVDVDLTAMVPGFSLNPTGNCPGMAICERAYQGSGDTWQSPYVTEDGHVHWNVGSNGDGFVSAAIDAWPIIGTGYSTEPFGCGPACNLQYVITTEQATPGQNEEMTTVPGLSSGGSFSCVFSREGDLGEGTYQGGIGGIQGNPLGVFAKNPLGGDSAFSYVEMMTLYRPSGGVITSAIKQSSTGVPISLATDCVAAGFFQIYANNEQITWRGQTASLVVMPSGSTVEAQCLRKQ